MIVLRNKRYNPKIDFLVCKQLINSVTPNCDEDQFKDCFNDVCKPKLMHEKEMVNVKNFFKKQSLNKFTNADIHNLYRIITNESWDVQQGILCPVHKISDVIQLANLVNKTTVNDKPTLFKILLLWGYYKANNKILIPYKYLCTNLYESILTGNTIAIKPLWERLIYKTKKCEQKHSLKDNAKAIAIVKEKCNAFLHKFGAENLYMFGSLAEEKGTEYSDIDLLVIFPDDTDLTGLKNECHQYWQSQLCIFVDLCIMNKQRFDNIGSPSIKRTLKKIGGTIYE